jgi:DNA-binding beta-propeller fold protein YncE
VKGFAMNKFNALILTLLITASAMSMANPKYMVCANDQRFILTDGLGKVMDEPNTGTVTILDFSAFPPKTTNIYNVPCSVIGPPTCAAVAPDESIAIIAAAMKVDPNDKTKQIPDNRLTVIDLESKTAVQTIIVGNQPSGISISKSGTFALVCNRADGTLTKLEINAKKVTAKETVKVCDPNESLAHVVISPDESRALATLNQAKSALMIPLKNGVPQTNIKRIAVNKGPYVVEFMPDNKTAAVANTMSDNVSIIEYQGDKIEVKDNPSVAILPEGMDVSPDGNWMTACCMNNTTIKPDDPNRQDSSKLVLLKKEGQSFKEVQRLSIDRIAQAAVFSPDMKYVVVTGFENKRLRIYKFENGKLSDTNILIETPGQPCALGTAK